MSTFFTYIATRSTADPYIPPRSASLDMFSRDVSDAFQAIAGGRLEVGSLAFYPLQRSVPNHLLCDGREVAQASFPELFSYLGNSAGAAAAGNFKLPNYLSTFAPATAAQPEATNAGTVSSPVPAVTPPTYHPERSDPLYGDVDSGGRLNPHVVIP